MPVTITLSDEQVTAIRENIGKPQSFWLQMGALVDSMAPLLETHSHICHHGCGTWVSGIEHLDANGTRHDCSDWTIASNHDTFRDTDGTPYPDNGTDRDRNVVG